MARPDVVVAGLGPAGRALTHRLLAAGATVRAIDPDPDRPWPQTLGGWADWLPDWLPGDVVAARAVRTVIRAPHERAVGGEYAVLDNARLQRALSIAGVDVETRAISDDDLAALAGVPVVDARGVRPGPRVPEQTAFGVVVPAALAGPVLDGADAVLMDWSPLGGGSWADRAPSFLYAIGLGAERVLLEETCLVGAPGLGERELRHRLGRRLRRFGLEPAAYADAPVERVRIPLVPGPALPGVRRFGAAGAQSNPFTGYSVFASLRAADGLAAEITSGGAGSRSDPGLLRRMGMSAVAGMPPDAVVDLFAAFSRLPRSRQFGVLDPTTPAPALLAEFAAHAWRMPPGSVVALVNASVRGLIGAP